MPPKRKAVNTKPLSEVQKQRKEKKNSDSNNVPPKKIKLKVSTEHVFEIELDKLASKPDTMLGKMFSTSYSLAKTNENGEYELKNVNPLIFKDMLNYYEGSKIAKPSLRANFLLMADYLQIPQTKETVEDYFLTEMCKEKKIIDELNRLFDERINPLMLAKKKVKKNYKINVIDERQEDDCEACRMPEVDDKRSFNHYVPRKTYKYIKTYDDAMERFFKSKGIAKLTKSTDVQLLERRCFTKDCNDCNVEYVILDFKC